MYACMRRTKQLQRSTHQHRSDPRLCIRLLRLLRMLQPQVDHAKGRFRERTIFS